MKLVPFPLKEEIGYLKGSHIVREIITLYILTDRCEICLVLPQNCLDPACEEGDHVHISQCLMLVGSFLLWASL